MRKRGRLLLTAAMCLGTSMMGVSLVMNPVAMADTPGAAPPSSGQAPTLVDNGSTVTLSNSQVSVTIKKNTGVITSMKDSSGKELLGNGGYGYFLANYSLGNSGYLFGVSGGPGGTNMVVVDPNHQETKTTLNYSVVTQNKNEIAIDESINDPSVLPFSIDLLFVLRRNSPGIYTYEKYGYSSQDASQVASQNLGPLHIGQTRYSVRVDPTMFTQYAVSNKRMGTLPTPQDIANSNTFTNATHLLSNGAVYTKYSYSQYQYKTRAYGFYGDGTGISFVTPHEDYLGGGPSRQDLTLEQTSQSPILLWQPISSHYGAPGVTPTAGWSKLYGPIFIYVNHTDSLQSMWQNDQQEAALQGLQWPYQWLMDPLYQASSRGRVVGHLQLPGTYHPIQKGWVVLASPGVDWQLQSLGYEAYAPLSPGGSFSIPAARPGTYTLYAFADGVDGQFELSNITVRANGVTNVGNQQWTPLSYGKTLWQIGNPSRSSEQFRNGANHYQFADYLQYPLDFPKGVNYYVGQSNYATDWNYVQPVYKTPGNNFEVQHFDNMTPNRTDPNPWTINFNLIFRSP